MRSRDVLFYHRSCNCVKVSSVWSLISFSVRWRSYTHSGVSCLMSLWILAALSDLFFRQTVRPSIFATMMKGLRGHSGCSKIVSSSCCYIPFFRTNFDDDTKEIIELLIDSDANIEAVNEDGCTPLDLAIRWNDDKDVVQLLLTKMWSNSSWMEGQIQIRQPAS